MLTLDGNEHMTKYNFLAYLLHGMNCSFLPCSCSYRTVTSFGACVTSQVEEEAEHKADLQRQLSKINAEAQMWKQKYEQDGLARWVTS